MLPGWWLTCAETRTPLPLSKLSRFNIALLKKKTDDSASGVANMFSEIKSRMFQEILPALSMLIHHSDINILVDTVSKETVSKRF